MSKNRTEIELSAKELRDRTWANLIKKDEKTEELYLQVQDAITASVEAGSFQVELVTDKVNLTRVQAVMIRLSDRGISGYVTKEDNNLLGLHVTWGALT